MAASSEASPGKLLWEPPQDVCERATLTRYMVWLRDERSLSFGDYQELWRWSVDELEDFWASVWEFCEVRASTPYDRVLADRSMPGAKWFTGAELNYAEHLCAGKDDAAVALLHASEGREQAQMTWGELRARAGSVAAGLRELGVEPGDRVVAYMP